MVKDKKSLERWIETISPLVEPKPSLEQHTTPSWIAAELLWNLRLSGRLEDRIIIDMGAGTGRLSLGALATGAREALALEIDGRQLRILYREALERGLEVRVHPILCDASRPPLRRIQDSLVLMNPPFGTVRRGADLSFLEAAVGLSDQIYSFHLSSPSTRRFLGAWAGGKGYNLTLINTYHMELKQVYGYHRSRIRRVPVDLLWFSRRSGDERG